MKRSAHRSKDGIAFYVGLSLLYLTIAAVMLWPITTHMTTSVLGGGSDSYQAMWSLWWVPYSLFTLHASPYFTNLLYYPVGANLITMTLFPFLGVLGAPLQAVNLAFELNVLTLVGFTLPGLFMYFLAHRITGNRYASFIAGFIYTFSAMHFAQSGGHVDYLNIEFIPLFLIFFLDMMRGRRARNMVYAAITLLFITFAGDIEQMLMTTVLVAVILVYNLIYDRKTVVNMRFAALLIGMFAIVFVLGSWAFIPMINGIRNGILGVVNSGSSISSSYGWSLDLASYFLPSWTNGIFAGIISSRPSYNNIFVLDTGERAGYLGYVVMFLILVAIATDYYETGLKRTRPWLVVLAFFGLLSLGPYVQVMAVNTSIPGIYLLYRLVPIFNIIREPGRFDLMVTLAAGVLAAIGLDAAMKRVKRKRLFLCAITAILLVEYWGAPLSNPMTAGRSVSAAIPEAYSSIGNTTGNYTVLVLPSEFYLALYNGWAMYYQTTFRKPILDGYTSRINQTEADATYATPLSGLDVHLLAPYSYPIVENYSNLTYALLAHYNVRYIGVLPYAFNQTQLSQLTGVLDGMFGQPAYSDNTTLVYDTSAGLNESAGKSLVAYVTGNWTEGVWSVGTCKSALCGYMWLGSNPRYITIYSPTPRDVNLSMNAYSQDGNESLDVALDSAPVTSFALNSTPQVFVARLNLSAGYSTLALIVPNANATATRDGYFAVNDITIT